MNLRELKAFRAVMTTGSMTRAAELLHVTQPAVSMLVASLEEAIGFKLFERRRGRVIPTAEALLLLDDAERTFTSLTDLERRADQIARRGVGQLRIASIYGPALQILPTATRRFREVRPDVAVSIVTNESKRVHEWVASQYYDFGIAETTDPNPAFEVEVIPQELACVMPRGHPLSGKETLTPADLSGLAMSTMPGWHRQNLELDAAFCEAGAERLVRYEVDMIATVIGLAAQGAAIGFADPVNITACRHLDFVARPFRPALRFDLAIFYPADRPRSSLSADFIGVLRDVFAETRRKSGL
ncbi:LysR substrate-binding domain-containing protein [Afifella sp. IM 167]|uniref:LysR substrate-binding domain-containing protein n=1 Tax=Afifella sp. IM 167 TaxID=2033586 RepID=UPI001CCC833D|nr:LysR substrate-binding domain-containing protein [Afifella sp. IM 167]MBZ8134455.1 LysR family transcriptional regulator [Afifella sp. IM 167]